MRISDWSSDVCTSDLAAAEFLGKLVALGDEGLQADGVDLADRAATEGREAPAHDRADIGVAQVDDDLFLQAAGGLDRLVVDQPRSEERRQGKEGFSTVSTRCPPFH